MTARPLAGVPSLLEQWKAEHSIASFPCKSSTKRLFALIKRLLGGRESLPALGLGCLFRLDAACDPHDAGEITVLSGQKPFCNNHFPNKLSLIPAVLAQ